MLILISVPERQPALSLLAGDAVSGQCCSATRRYAHGRIYHRRDQSALGLIHNDYDRSGLCHPCVRQGPCWSIWPSCTGCTKAAEARAGKRSVALRPAATVPSSTSNHSLQINGGLLGFLDQPIAATMMTRWGAHIFGDPKKAHANRFDMISGGEPQ
ncbi:hypothetical protein SPHINGOT1_80167 [Sphingomonas sp. T1]|nr:hypothetical protein SPHINGOT1_80167 [Sphingomonas sp. T1]